jgi:hypothetical protein
MINVLFDVVMMKIDHTRCGDIDETPSPQFPPNLRSVTRETRHKLRGYPIKPNTQRLSSAIGETQLWLFVLHSCGHCGWSWHRIQFKISQLQQQCPVWTVFTVAIVYAKKAHASSLHSPWSGRRAGRCSTNVRA